MKKKSKQEEKLEETKDDSEIVKDQTERGYYYDDACGYEVYVEEEEDKSQKIKQVRNK